MSYTSILKFLISSRGILTIYSIRDFDGIEKHFFNDQDFYFLLMFIFITIAQFDNY